MTAKVKAKDMDADVMTAKVKAKDVMTAKVKAKDVDADVMTTKVKDVDVITIIKRDMIKMIANIMIYTQMNQASPR
jgi:hypothetical protein